MTATPPASAPTPADAAAGPEGGLGAVVSYLRCPVCGADLEAADRSLRCSAGHSFDIAREGYVNLIGGKGGSGAAGDTPAMVQARKSFLARGHFDPLSDALAHELSQELHDGPPGCLVDVGAGTGHHLAYALERLPGRLGLALDRSKPALRSAARAHARIGAVAADAWQPLPLRSGAAAATISVFAPRDGAELARILHAGGAAIVVTPTERHLVELIGPLRMLTVDPNKHERMRRRLDPHLGLRRRSACERSMSLTQESVRDLVAMGPSAHHVDASAIAARIAALPEPVLVTLSVELAVYHPAAGARLARGHDD